jgi:hypothetical protein
MALKISVCASVASGRRHTQYKPGAREVALRNILNALLNAPGFSNFCLDVPSRTNALNSIEKMREKASMIQQQWIIGLTSPTVIGDIASFVHRIPECDLKGWILQNDAPQCICTRASTQFSELPLGMLKKHVVISQTSWHMFGGHLYRTCLHEIVLRCRATAFAIGVKIQNKPFKFADRPVILAT